MATMSTNAGWGPSKIATEAMCIWLTSSSTFRNEASSGLSRSVLTGCSLHEETAVRSVRTVPPEARDFSWSDPAAAGVSARGGGRGGADGGEEGTGKDSSPGLFVGCFDHLRGAILGHGPQAHGTSRLGARLESDDRRPLCLESGDLALAPAVDRPTQEPIGPDGAATPGRHGGDDDDRVELVCLEHVGIGARVHAAIEVLGPLDGDRREVPGDGARRQHGRG